MIYVTDELSIDESEISEKFVRAGGPGGQNVNKVSTAVQLRFDAANSQNLDSRVRARLIALAGSRATLEGVILIEADRYRTREQNRSDALERLVELIKKATFRPKPRRKTRPTRASKERRIKAKKGRADIKKSRRKVSGDE